MRRTPEIAPSTALLVAAALLGGCAGAPSPRTASDSARAPMDAAALARLSARADAVLAAHGFLGAAVLVRDGAIVYERGVGFADREAQRRFTPATPSDGASIAKTFTAAALQALADEGRLSFDDRVSRHVPEYPYPATTVRHLLTHSAGLPEDYDVFDADFPPGRVRTTEPLLHALARRRSSPDFATGTRFRYSSFGYDIAALVVERVSGKSYEVFVRERFFVPLGMTEAVARPARFADWPDRTLGYRLQGEHFVRRDVFDDEGFLGGSNLYFSARDLGRWASAFATRTGVSSGVLDAAAEGATLAGGRRIGLSRLSWYCADERGNAAAGVAAVQCYYPGDLRAFYSIAYWNRSRHEAMAYVSNHSLPPWQRAQLARELIAALGERTPPAPVATSPAPLPPERWALVGGRYDSPSHGVLVIAANDTGGMLLTDRHGVEYPMFRVGDGVCTVPGLDWWVGFEGGTPPVRMLIRTVFGDDIAVRHTQHADMNNLAEIHHERN